MNNIRETLIGLTAEILARRPEITDDSVSLYQDLGIAGDDAYEFLEEVQKLFGTKFQGFDFASYFHNETEVLPSHIGKLFGIEMKKKRLTFRHLMRVIEAGHWMEPVTS